MTCDELKALLADYVGADGVLVVAHERHETVTVHVKGCPKCEVYVSTYSRTVRVVRALPKCGPLPPALEARLRAALAEHLSEEAK
ncbi:hypothetical protein GobsT_64960 [Gemmata obscuriglobus]|uniref:Zinc-finger domain-containing protein n=2 Tax=Gemmata TaxID=113 RepID=A0A2Z3GR76_9BACT|nr:MULTISPECIES: hypothetical protein [Gemmata]AWM35808.1 hypothetical protein C1280_01370 [Gemmata obscuriglobus]MDY3556700.1 hypothetical protein [Gemmata algarum]MDY3561026.1 hypothetical protein [Gemmata algarum]QEG31652.1 hypothetical protein GobsT_64960 [Gemmata obscuriglobus]VTS10997.1 unnamed protein product [Gemmata obscuriglobus UQM 2246]